MKIAQIVSTFPPYRGGMGNSVCNMAEALVKLGYNVTVFTPAYGDWTELDDYYQPYQPESRFAVKRLKPIFKFGRAAVLPQLAWKLKNFDIVHLHYPFFGSSEIILLLKLVKRRKMKLILHYHMDSRAVGLKGAVFFIYKIVLLPLIVRAADLITCASLDYVKHSDLRKYYFRRPNKFKQISFGVKLEQFVTYHDDLNVRRRQGVILFVGGLDWAHYFKGLNNLIEALARIVKDKKFSSTALAVVGRGELIAYYQERARRLGLEKRVSFHTEADNNKLVDFYNYCDCLVLPSINRGEAFGLALLEAMSCSKPVVAANLPGVRSVFKNGVQGLLVKPGDVNDLAEKIKYILKDKKRARQMGRAGRELVEKKYTWEKVAARLDLIFHLVKYGLKI